MLNNRSPLTRVEATDDPPPPTPAPRYQPRSARFLSVGRLAKVLDMSEATLYRAIRAGEFPAVKIRGRYVVPAKVLDAMEDAAMTSGGMVDAADWVDRPGVA